MNRSSIPRPRSFLVAAALAVAAPTVASAQPDGAAARGAPAARPAWCNHFSYPHGTSYGADWFDDVEEASMVRSPKVAEVLGEATCATRWDSPRERDKLMAIRSRYMALMGFDEADFAVAAGEARGYVEDEQDLTTLTGPVAQLADSKTLDELGARASTLRRFVHVHRCLEVSLATPPDQRPLMDVILCTREQLDVAAARAEIDASKPSGRTRKDLRLLVQQTAVAAAKAKAFIAELAREEPGIARMVAIADAQFAEWAAPTPTRARLIAGLEAMEAASRSSKRSAYAGCAESTRAAWEDTLRGRELPKAAGDDVVDRLVVATVGTADGYLAQQALRLCARGGEDESHRGRDLIPGRLERRGPRSATLAEWAAAAGVIEFDDRDLERQVIHAVVERGGPLRDTVAGVIASITEQGNDVEITFKRNLVKVETCVAESTTARIVRIDEQGNVHYWRDCVKWGKRTIDRAPDPITAGKVAAHGLAKGMFLTALADGTPVVATASPASSKAIWLLGATVP